MTMYFGNTGQQIDWDNIITNIDNMNITINICLGDINDPKVKEKIREIKI
jgi:hypothetical protein